MQAELIAIGDEILIGQTIDTNSAFIASQLNLNGVKVKQKHVVADDADDIKAALDGILPDTQLVFMTGGLGPTKDDITKKTLTDYFGGELKFYPEVFENIKRLFATFNRTPTEMNRAQAYLPDSCVILPNDTGTAAGMRFEKDGKYFFSLPGVPYETEHLVKDRIIPWITENLQRGTVVHKTFLTQGVPESELAEMLEEWQDRLPPDISLAYLPSPGMVRLRLTTYEGTQKEAEAAVNAEAEKLKSILGNFIFGEDLETLEQVVGKLLGERGLSLSTAESCTGGAIAQSITSVPGCSAHFMGSVVSYSERSKQELLGVDAKVIEKQGVVSKEVVEQMALGAKKRFHCSFAVATTGIAGPDGGTEENPVGTIWIAVAGPERVKSRKFRFGKNRSRNIRIATLTALNMLRKEIQKIEI